jgi:TatD DNase family protein
LIDSHAHLTMRKYRNDLDAVLSRARDAGITAMVNVGFDVDSSADGVHLAQKQPVDAYVLSYLEELSEDPNVVAIGEIGLDFYRNLSPRRVQEEVFVKQLALAEKVGLPVIIHDRDAHRRVVEILKAEGASHGVMHCFSGDMGLAKQVLDLGFYISFAGPITYNGGRAGDIMRKMPPDRLLVETDCPYLTPVPYRGKRNEPAYVRYVAERVARFIGRSVEEVEALTDENARRFFNLPS